jgi:hypothetical protein
LQQATFNPHGLSLSVITDLISPHVAALQRMFNELEQMVSPPKIVLALTKIKKVLKRIQETGRNPRNDEFQTSNEV